ncbi:hypothetical protein PR048_000850 [Dryococelus australis]|uniref:CHK kinase-like domain-containing protein n=1 Tax=Dryococelus australis TaxID=614101 RepID=A0ABQ9IFU5_9NEOP|nr:hypothetical protein PR048_000850 [Dryococelus australis]
MLVGSHLLPHNLTGNVYAAFLREALPTLLEDVPLKTRAVMWFQHDGALANNLDSITMSSTVSETSTPWTDRIWTQNVLRAVEQDPSLSITDYHVKVLSSNGDYYLSEMQRIAIKLLCAGNKVSNVFLMVKKLPPGNKIQKILSESSSFPNEIKMFSQVLPKCQAILEGSAPGRFRQFAARHIYSQNKCPYFLIFSDLATEGFRMAKRQRGLDLDHCLLVMKSLGRYHAVSVALHDRDPQLVESFKENFFSEEATSDFVKSLSRSSIVSIANLARLWPEGGETMASKLLHVADTICERLRQQLSPEHNRLNVLIHGDLWTNNMLFKYDEVTGSVEDIRLVDFQQACYTSCAIDLQYFIHTSPRDDVRVEHTEDILREYHSELCSTLQLLGQEKKAVTFEELMEEYERKGVYGFIISVYVLPLFMADSQNAADMNALLNGGDQPTSSGRAANKEFVKVLLNQQISKILAEVGLGVEVEVDENSTPWTDRIWTQNVVRAVEQDPSLSITDYHVKVLSSNGDYYLSEMQRIAIKLLDLATEGFRMAKRQRGLDLDHCLLVMKSLGRYHAVSVALHDRDPQLVESFKENFFSEEATSDFVKSLSRSSIVSIANLARLWPEGGETMASKLLHVADTICERLRQQLSPEHNRLNVLIHGDLWTNNMLFKYNEVTGSVEDIRLVDFQQACYTSCAIDLQYFIHTSPRDDVRVEHTEDILREYHSELCSTLQLLGQEKKAVTFEELMEEYERKGVYGFIISVYVLPLFMADSQNAADMNALLNGGDQPTSSGRAANKEFVKSPEAECCVGRCRAARHAKLPLDGFISNNVPSDFTFICEPNATWERTRRCSGTGTTCRSQHVVQNRLDPKTVPFGGSKDVVVAHA